MSRDPHEGPDGPGLPDFHQHSTVRPSAVTSSSAPSRSRAAPLVIAVVGASVVIIAVIALVLSQTVFRSPLANDPTPPPAPTSGSASGHSEYIPDPKDPDLAPPPPIFTQAPSAACTVQGQESTSPQQPGHVRGGSLQYTVPPNWDFPWTNGDLAYVTDAAGMGRHVEDDWYSVVNLARVTWPKKDGSYPGAEKAAVTIFQCYATSAGLIGTFGDKPKVTDYRTEATTVDGTAGWIVQATYHFNAKNLASTHESIVTSLVVDTPGGPSVLISDVAGDHPDHVKALHSIISSLKVTS